MEINKHLPGRRLRERPDLDQLKRQAKELLEAFRHSEASAKAEVQAHYRDADPVHFALHDAQLALARSYGFDSWPKIKAYVEGVTVQRLAEAVSRGDVTQVRAMLKARPELVNRTVAVDNEHRAIHLAVLARSPETARVLMQHGADARLGIYPHREATTAFALAKERGYDEIVAVLQDEERRRQSESAELVSAADELTEAMLGGNDKEVTDRLIREPGLIDATNRGGWRPLHVAAGLRNASLVAWLLKHGAEPDEKGPGERTPLDLAVGRHGGQTEAFAAVVEALRSGGARTTARSAAALGDAAWMRARHAERALTNEIEDSGGLLTIAVRYGQLDVLRLLLELGFDPGERMRIEELEEPLYSGGMPLWNCARSGQYAMAQLLLTHGADPNQQVYASGSPVYSAYKAGDEPMVALLNQYGGIVDPITAALFHETEIAKRMLAGGARQKSPDSHYAGDTVAEHLLWGAVCSGDAEIVRASLEHVDWSRGDSHWYEMLEQPLRSWNQSRTTASQDAYVECFRVILERCDPNLPHPRIRRTILHDVAGARAHVPDEATVAFARLLLDAGARLDARDQLLKSTPLAWACRFGRVELVKLFLARGADPVEADAETWATPKAWAEKRNHPVILAILQNAS